MASALAVRGQLRALDELVAKGLLRPEDYATRQAALLKGDLNATD
jgi:hypothetical protein